MVETPRTRMFVTRGDSQNRKILKQSRSTSTCKLRLQMPEDAGTLRFVGGGVAI
jgi:hypothetical protein